MKTIKVFEITAYAIEVLRIALQVQLGRQITFGEHNLWVGRERKFKNDGREWQVKTQFVEGDFGYKTPSNRELYAEIELSSQTGAWRAGRIFFSTNNPYSGEGMRDYVAHCEYLNLFGQTGGVKYPDFVRSVRGGLNDKSGRYPWRVGDNFDKVQEIPFGDWDRVKDTIVV